MSRATHHSEPGVLAPGRPRPTPPDVVLEGLARVLRLALELSPEDVEETPTAEAYPASLSRSRSGA